MNNTHKYRSARRAERHNLFIYLSDNLSIYLPTYLPASLPAYLTTYSTLRVRYLFQVSRSLRHAAPLRLKWPRAAWGSIIRGFGNVNKVFFLPGVLEISIKFFFCLGFQTIMFFLPGAFNQGFWKQGILNKMWARQKNTASNI